MKIEYSYFDISSNDVETKSNISQAIKLGVDCISILPGYIKNVKSESYTAKIPIACPIDYPLGTLDLKSRISALEFGLKNGADIFDIVLPSYYLCHRKYDKFREEISTLSSIVKQYNKEIRYFLEYRVYSYDLLYKVTQILLELGITECFPSTGYLLDDINDNIIASAMINKKSHQINIIINGNVWNSKQVEVILKNKPYGIRVNSINALNLLKNHKN
jgi:deoxyribose-phosphate aldolase